MKELFNYFGYKTVSDKVLLVTRTKLKYTLESQWTSEEIVNYLFESGALPPHLKEKCHKIEIDYHGAKEYLFVYCTTLSNKTPLFYLKKAEGWEQY